MPKLTSQTAITAILLACSTALAGESDWLSDWLTYNGHRYRMSTPMSWSEAETLATSVGGHLVTINDEAENEWVFQNLMPFSPEQSQGLWIGFMQPKGSPEPDGGWEWTSGDEVTYINWSGGSPNNNGNENAANMYGPSKVGSNGEGDWNDFNEDFLSLPGVVEKGCFADFNGDGVVNATDLAQLLGAWGPCPEPPTDCPADIHGDGDGIVQADDLATLLGAWGPCE